MSDTQIIKAIVLEHAFSLDSLTHTSRRVTDGSAHEAAKALYEAGFRMVADDDRLEKLESRVTRIEGYTGLPSYFEIPVVVKAKR